MLQITSSITENGVRFLGAKALWVNAGAGLEASDNQSLVDTSTMRWIKRCIAGIDHNVLDTSARIVR
jgi:hypothetical protein